MFYSMGSYVGHGYNSERAPAIIATPFFAPKQFSRPISRQERKRAGIGKNIIISTRDGYSVAAISHTKIFTFRFFFAKILVWLYTIWGFSTYSYFFRETYFPYLKHFHPSISQWKYFQHEKILLIKSVNFLKYFTIWSHCAVWLSTNSGGYNACTFRQLRL